jgi:hypothetical protein
MDTSLRPPARSFGKPDAPVKQPEAGFGIARRLNIRQGCAARIKIGEEGKVYFFALEVLPQAPDSRLNQGAGGGGMQHFHQPDVFSLSEQQVQR